jgi:hypothetical protein
MHHLVPVTGELAGDARRAVLITIGSIVLGFHRCEINLLQLARMVELGYMPKGTVSFETVPFCLYQFTRYSSKSKNYGAGQLSSFDGSIILIVVISDALIINTSLGLQFPSSTDRK